MTKDSDSGRLVTNAKRLDLCRIRPRNWEEAKDIAVQVQEDECDGSGGVGGALVLQGARDDEQADRASTR